MTPSLGSVVRWVLSITRPVHAPLYFSVVMRIIQLSLGILIFGLAVQGVVGIILGVNQIVPILITLAIMACIKALVHYLEQFSGHHVAFKALELLRGAAFSQLWPKAPGVLRSTKSGDLVTSLTRDIDRIEVLYAHTIAPVIAGVTVPLGFGVAWGVIYGWQLSAIPLVLGLFSALVVPLIGAKRSFDSTQKVLSERRKLSQHVTDSVFGAEEIVSYGRQQERVEQSWGIAGGVAKLAMPAANYRALRRGLNLGLTYACVLGVLVVGIANKANPTEIAFIMGGCLLLFDASRGLEDAAGALDHSLAAARRLHHICHIPATVTDGTLNVDRSQPITITWENVSYAYPDSLGKPVLQGFTHTIASSEHAIFVAPSGSGKSTAVHLLLRFDDPSSGDILLNGISVSKYQLSALREAIALVPQRSELLTASIRSNLLLARPDATEEAMWHVLSAVHLDQEVRRLPQGLDSLTGTEVSGLSGGQMQRLCLARALLTQPSVLVLDEFTANVNAELDQAIRRSLKEHYPNLTIIEISHRLHEHSDDQRIISLSP
ncbi:amino acid ABC transporter ATP-binding/permease protein [Corynebacterium pseudotuberculosis]|uniref:amino acid ABC transporter ATP-binding/permease protein n=1 Tax=Corynebacterium pseudotuberculosis TaxID=1719 RepID=UPI00097ACB07|nr:ABC transporter ATP-binding protein [Corynebacterium pseudotuberculosis]OMH75084.1 ABC transporter permease [Corynebacterium pseudotuberculosis]WAF30802.1 ABC transporter ATP-binding protein/permease [Corynebacterium pseudotuberculosis]